MHSDLLTVVLLQFWFSSDHLWTVHPSASSPPPSNPNSSIFLSTCPEQRLHTLIDTVFFYKSWSPGFSSSSTRIHPSILGPAVVFQAYRSWANLQLSCRTVDGASGHTARSLFHPVGRWLESLLCIVNKQARGAPVQVRCLLSAASHREFFTSQTPGKFSFS